MGKPRPDQSGKPDSQQDFDKIRQEKRNNAPEKHAPDADGSGVPYIQHHKPHRAEGIAEKERNPQPQYLKKAMRAGE